MKPLNLDPAVLVRYATHLTYERVKRVMGEPDKKPVLPKLLDTLPSSIRDTVQVEVAKIANSIASHSNDDVAIFIFDYLESAKAHAADAIDQWKHLIQTGQHTGSKSVYQSVQNDIAKVDCDIYPAIYAASVELDPTGQLLNEYTIIRRNLDKELQRIRDNNKSTYPKPKTQRDLEKLQYLAEMKMFTHNVTAWADQIIKQLSLPEDELN